MTAQKSGGFFANLGKAGAALGPLLPISSVIGLGTALVGLGSKAIESAGNLVDLSKKTGLSTDALQEMEHVAHQTGTELSTFTDATFKLGTNLATGTDKVRAAVADLGLGYDQLRAKRPEDQFNDVIKALEGIDNVQERNRIGVALFGKQFGDMAAAVAEGYSSIAAAANKSSQDQLEALDNVGDEWGEFVDDVEKEVSRLLSTLVLLGRGGGGQGRTGSLIELTPGELIDYQAFKAAGGAMEDWIKKLLEQRKHQVDVKLTTDQTTAATRDYVAELAAVNAKLKELNPQQRAQLDAAIKLEGVTEDVGTAFGLTQAEIRLYQAAIKQAEPTPKRIRRNRRRPPPR